MRTTKRATPRLRVASLFLGGMTLITIGVTAALATALFADESQVFIVSSLAWGLAGFNGVFHPYITRDDMVTLPKIMLAGPTAAALTPPVQWILQLDVGSMSSLVATAVFTVVALVIGQLAGRSVLRHLWSRGDYRSTALLVGNGEVSRELGIELDCSPELGIDVVEYIDSGDDQDSSAASALREALDRWNPDRLIVGESATDDLALLSVLRRAGTMGTRVYLLPRMFAMGVGSPLFCPDRLRGYPLLRVNRSAHPHLARAAKRAIDAVSAFVALTLLAPLLAATAVAVKASSRGPILFWQERIGAEGTTIHIPKFRSMTMSATSDTEWTADSRITPLGRFLRRSAIDELPQLWSVLTGDMSLVGPRPERPAFSEQFATEHPGYEDRLRMRVGLTGLSQIAGLRGDTSIAERAKYDNLYIDQWTLTGDIVILLRTFGAIASERTSARQHALLDEAIQRHNETAVVDLSHTDDHHRHEAEPRQMISQRPLQEQTP